MYSELLFMLIYILVIIPLPSREDFGMLYVYEYVLRRDVGSKKPQLFVPGCIS